MKTKNPNSNNNPISTCYKPKVKDLKLRLKSAIEAKDMIDDLYRNDYIPYDISHIVRGSIRLIIEDIKEQISNAKGGKKWEI